MGARGPDVNPLRDAFVDCIRQGELTVVEVAHAAGVSRQRVVQWCDAAGIDPAISRAAHVGRVVRRVLAKAAGKKLRKPSKSQLRRIADRAVAKFNRRQRESR